MYCMACQNLYHTKIYFIESVAIMKLYIFVGWQSLLIMHVYILIEELKAALDFFMISSLATP